MRLKCAANLRSLGQAMFQYANDNKGWIPRDYTHGNPNHRFWGEKIARLLNYPMPPEQSVTSVSYDMQMRPYFARMEMFQCPSFPKDQQELDFVLNGWDIDYPGGQTGTYLKITSLRRASELILATEANKNRALDTLDKHDVWHPEHLPGSGAGSDIRVCDDQRHLGYVQIVYVDAHVNSRKWKELKVEDFRLDRR
jgi:hypothetical protein